MESMDNYYVSINYGSDEIEMEEFDNGIGDIEYISNFNGSDKIRMEKFNSEMEDIEYVSNFNGNDKIEKKYVIKKDASIFGR